MVLRRSFLQDSFDIIRRGLSRNRIRLVSQAVPSSAAKTRSGVIGVSLSRIPVALNIAFPIAGATGTIEASPSDFGPKGSSVSMKMDSIFGALFVYDGFDID